MSDITFWLYRETPLHDWEVVSHWEAPVSGSTAGEFIPLPGVHWYSQAIVERDRENGKGEGQQTGLPL